MSTTAEYLLHVRRDVETDGLPAFILLQDLSHLSVGAESGDVQELAELFRQYVKRVENENQS